MTDVEVSASAPDRAARWSIRTRLRVVLLGLLLLLIPQTGLTVYYLSELQTESAHLAGLSGYVLELGIARSAVSGVRDPAAIDAVQADLDKLLSAIDVARRRLGPLADGADHLAAAASQVLQDLDHLERAARDWYTPILALADALSEPARAARLGIGPAGDPEVQRLERELRGTRHGLSRAFDEAFTVAYDALRADQDYLERVVRHADRNLIALTMITFVFVLVVVVTLPARLVGPLHRLTRAVRVAGPGGRLRSFDAADRETSALATAFSETMERCREFDQMKRDRILADEGKIRTLLDRIGAAAIVDSGLVVEHQSGRFTERLGLPADDDPDRGLADRLGEAGTELRARAKRVLHSREPLRGLEVQVPGPEGTARSVHLDLELCRERGKPHHLLIVVHEGPAGQ